MKRLAVYAAATVFGLTSAVTVAGSSTPPGVAAFVQSHKLTRYTVALVDLDGDKKPEALIYAMATSEGGGQADLCGSGGCDLYVLALTPTGYRQITDISVARPPVRVLPTATHGWHDLGVMVAGGGIIRGYEARLRYDGHSYPSNPTVAPAIKLRATVGRQIIGEDADQITSTSNFVIEPTGTASKDDASITADIELSEWTPPMRVALNLGTGRYVIRPSSTTWPKIPGRPDPRHGTLQGEALRNIRAKFASAVAEGISDAGCVNANGKGYPGILSNAGVPRMTLNTGDRELQTSSIYGCWTRSAYGLHQALTNTFDRKTP